MSTTCLSTFSLLHTETPNATNQIPKLDSTDASLQQALAVAKIYRERKSLKAAWAIATNYMVSASCVAIVESAFRTSQMPAVISYAFYYLSLLIIASRMRAMENLVHEASHSNLFSSAPLHQRSQFLYAFPVFRVLEDYRRSHMVHHKHLGNPQKDPDILRLHALGLDHLPERPVGYLLGMPMTGYLTYEYLMTTFREFWGSPSCRWSKSVFWFAVLLVVWWTDTFRIFAYYYLIPFFAVLPVTRYWAECAEHLGLDLREQFGSSRTNIGILHMWLINPLNDGYHAAHHVCGQIPFHLLPEAHDHLMKASTEYAKKTTISRGMVETFVQIATKKTIFKEVAWIETPKGHHNHSKP